MLRKCSNCGTEHEERRMIEINTGRTQFICWDCYKLGHGEAHMAEFGRVKRIERLHSAKKREK